MSDRHWSHFNLNKRIKEEWKEDCILTNTKKFDWEKFGAKKAAVHRGGSRGNDDRTYILHTPKSDKSREQFNISLSERDSAEIIETIGNKVDIGTANRLNDFVIIVASGEALTIYPHGGHSKRKSFSCGSIKNEIKKNLGDDFYHYELKIERIAGEQAYILYPIDVID